MSANKLVVITLVIFVGIGAWAVFAVNQVEKISQSEKVKGRQTERSR